MNLKIFCLNIKNFEELTWSTGFNLPIGLTDFILFLFSLHKTKSPHTWQLI